MERLKHIVQVNIHLGAWLIIAPFVMGYSASTAELANDVTLGVILVACSWWILAAETSQLSASTLELLGGLWLIAAPFVFQYERHSRAFRNDIIVGTLSALISLTATWMLTSNQKTAA
jgi:hypothetical protein